MNETLFSPIYFCVIAPNGIYHAGPTILCELFLSIPILDTLFEYGSKNNVVSHKSVYKVQVLWCHKVLLHGLKYLRANVFQVQGNIINFNPFVSSYDK